MHPTETGSAGVPAGLLSPDDSRRLARELRCWSATAQEAVRGLLQRQFEAWRARWGLDADGAAAPGLVLLETSGSSPAGTIGDAEACELLAVRMFGDASVAVRPGGASHGGVTPMAAEIAAEAWADWAGTLQGIAPPWQPARLQAADAAAAWQGWLHFSFAWWGRRWPLALDAAAVDKLLADSGTPPPRPPAAADRVQRVSAAHALRHRPLAVRVELNPVSISLGELAVLALGDVVALPHRLDLPARLLLDAPDGPPGAALPLCSAWLGQRRGRMALELAPAAGH